MVNQIETFNNNVQANIGAEATLKRANEFLIMDLRNQLESLSEAEKAELQNLASQCPMVGGNGVYTARYVYSSINPLADYNDGQICENFGLFKANQEIANSVIASKFYFKLYPNPADDMITVEYDLKTSEKGLFEAYDVTGRSVLQMELSSQKKQVKLEMSSYPRGQYFYKYMINGKTVISNKLILQ